MRAIASRLRLPLPGTGPAFALLGARREQFVEAIDAMDRGYETRAPTPNLREVHREIGRRFREVYVALEAVRRLPPDFEGQEAAAQMLATHFSEGLSFTQKPVHVLVPEAQQRLSRMLDDPRMGRVPDKIVDRVEQAVVALQSAPPAPRSVVPGRLATAIHRANVALHAYARLLDELSGIELTARQVEELAAELDAPPPSDLPAPN